MTAFALALTAAAVAVEASADEILDGMMESWRSVSALTYSMRKVERLRDGDRVEEGVEVKLQTRPMRLYVAAVVPRRGQEIIYDTTVDPDTFLVHPGRFPDFTLRLDLRGGLATERQHHLLSHSGFNYLLAALQRDRRASEVSVVGRGEVQGREVVEVRMSAREIAPRAVVARAGETLHAFADRVGQDAYYIYYSNPVIDDLTDELEARSYVVPVTYGARTDIAIDLETRLPLRLVVFDAEGREYERLEFSDVRVNAKLGPRAFDPDNPAYDF